MLRSTLALVLFSSVAVTGCQYEDPDIWIGHECLLGSWTEDDTCTGLELDPELLTYGQEQYILYCMACHGLDGDGRGPASRYLRPAPRDLRIASYKFGKVIDGLPHDEDFLRILNHGLKGTAMLAWEDIPDPTMNSIVQYIKTFSPEGEGWRDPDNTLGVRMVAGADPWEGKRAEAIEEGRKQYHALQCWSCHPAYARPNDIKLWTREIKGTESGELRPNLFYPEAKTSELYTVGWPSLPECEGDKDCEGDTQKCVTGRCEVKLKIRPPDFMFDDIRAGGEPPEIFSTIAAGIPGSGMPQWKGTISDRKIWAMSHYVNWLTGWKDTAQAVEMKRRLAHAAKTDPPLPPMEKKAEPAKVEPAKAEPVKAVAPGPAPAENPAAPAAVEPQ